ncbi:MAG: hypothetical protein AB1641_28765 [Thermodesulfobacteriota bacterium]
MADMTGEGSLKGDMTPELKGGYELGTGMEGGGSSSARPGSGGGEEPQAFTVSKINPRFARHLRDCLNRL